MTKKVSRLPRALLSKFLFMYASEYATHVCASVYVYNSRRNYLYTHIRTFNHKKGCPCAHGETLANTRTERTRTHIYVFGCECAFSTRGITAESFVEEGSRLGRR